MASVALSCFPRSDFDSGLLVLEERKEDVFLGEVIFLIGGTLLYPVVFALAAIAEIYLLIDLLYRSCKILAVEKKIEALKTLSPEEIEKLKDKRLAKLEQRKKEQANEVLSIMKNIIKEACKDGYGPEKNLIEYIEGSKIERDEIFEMTAETIFNIARFVISQNCRGLDVGGFVEKAKVIRAYKRPQQEIQMYKNAASPEAIREVFATRYKFSKIRSELAQKIDAHYLYNMAFFQIPVVGLVMNAYSTYTTKQALEETDIVDRYNNMISDHPWLKPYSKLLD